MLYKPTSPSPYAKSVVLKEDELINFNCTMMGGMGIESARLKISDGNTQYYFSSDDVLLPYAVYSSRYISSGGYIHKGGKSSLYVYEISYDESVSYNIVGDNVSKLDVYFYKRLVNSSTTLRKLYRSAENSKATECKISSQDFLDEYPRLIEGEVLYLYIDVGTASTDTVFTVSQYTEAQTSNMSCGYTKNGTNSLLSFGVNSSDYYSGYSISNKNSDIRSNGLNLCISDICTPNTEYTWQARLYEKGSLSNENYRSDIWLGYGTIEDTGYTSNVYGLYGNYYYLSDNYKQVKYADCTRICLKVRPHTNIYFAESTNNVTSIQKGSNKIDVRKYYTYYDDNARYYVKIGNKYHRIVDYRFYPPSTSNVTTINDYFDSYGEPINGYIVIEHTPESADDAYLQIGDQYEIFCNYIDSDEFYFNFISEPTLTLYGTDGKVIDGGANFEETGFIISTLNYSNLDITGEYTHSGGATIEKYRVTLYNAENEKMIHTTGDVYSSEISYVYDTPNGVYRLDINVCDTLGYSFERTEHFVVEFDEITLDAAVSVDYYPSHDSVLISWEDNTGNSFEGVSYFEVFKQIGNQGDLYKVYSTEYDETDAWAITDEDNSTTFDKITDPYGKTSEGYTPVITCVEDFAVGNLCEYTYYIYPVVCREDDNGFVTKMVQSPIKSQTVSFDGNSVTIFGLIQDEEDLTTYTVDDTAFWEFTLNVENTGTTLNFDKTFTDTQHKFPKAIGGTRKYNTATVKGLIGRYDCTAGDYRDNYDLLTEWENFAASNTLKLLKDARGRLIPCDIDGSSIEYMSAVGSPATVSFSVKQLEEIGDIAVLGRAISSKTSEIVLQSSEGAALETSDNELLTVNES